jgi:hypothetical protein
MKRSIFVFLKKEGKSGLKNWQILSTLLVLIALSGAVLFEFAPVFHPIPDRDSGGFMYISQQMLRGQRLYADLYDDKPPVIFLVNALGLWLSGGSAWGVWALEVVSLSVTVILGFFLLAGSTGFWPAVLALAALLANFTSFAPGGNLTEEYALPFQFLILICILTRDLDKRLTWRAYLAGLAWGMVFFCKQSIFGIGIAAGAFLFVRGIWQWKRGRFWEVAWYLAGFMTIAGVAAGYFLSQGTLYQFWDATFLSNFAYITIHTDTNRVILAFRTLTELMIHGPFLAGALLVSVPIIQGVILAADIYFKEWQGWPGWLLKGTKRLILFGAGGGLLIVMSISVDFLLGKNKFDPGIPQIIGIFIGLEAIIFGLVQKANLTAGWIKNTIDRVINRRAGLLAIFAAVSFPLDVISISLSGKFFTHYYLIIFPAAVILTALFARILLTYPRSLRAKIAGCAILIAFLTPAAFLPLAETPQGYHVRIDPQRETVAAFILSTTKPGDQVLMWGGEPQVNFVAGRTRPNRFVFMTQLFLHDYSEDVFAAEMLRDLQAHRPELIIDTTDCQIPFIDYKQHACVPVTQGWDAVFSFIQQNYQPVIDLGPAKWDVYRLIKPTALFTPRHQQ